MPKSVPLRVDIAGGWLDVPHHARPGAFVVNCTIGPCVTQDSWPYQFGGGLGGSAAKAVLDGVDAVASELLSAGWQDPAVILETGLCVWRSGPTPILDFKVNPDFFAGKMALLWTGKPHVTGDLVNKHRRYTRIEQAANIARLAVLDRDYDMVCAAVHQSYSVQLDEDMAVLPMFENVMAKKYCGSGHGGYAVYFFPDSGARKDFKDGLGPVYDIIEIEPYMNFGGLTEY